MMTDWPNNYQIINNYQNFLLIQPKNYPFACKLYEQYGSILLFRVIISEILI